MTLRACAVCQRVDVPKKRPVPAFSRDMASVTKTEHVVVRDEWRGAG